MAAWPKRLAGGVEPNSPGVPAGVAEPNRPPPPPPPNKPGDGDVAVAAGCAPRLEKNPPVAAGAGDGADPGAGRANMGADAVAGACMWRPL